MQGGRERGQRARGGGGSLQWDTMTSDTFLSISPLDGRYRPLLDDLRQEFSECALMRHRFHVEAEWLLFLAESPEFREIRNLSGEEVARVRSWATDFAADDLAAVKQIERETNHDVKAVEYYFRSKMAGTSLQDLTAFTHFACTSEDVNNLAYGRMLQRGLHDIWGPHAAELARTVAGLADLWRDVPMLSRTHGQAATPTTVGKELAVFVYRWERQRRQVLACEILGKINGAVGTYGAHMAAYPHAPWTELSRVFVQRMGLVWNPLTTQIESHDYMAEIFHAVMRWNSVLNDFNTDIWSYVSLGYFRQSLVAGQIGSSTMPHKVNPIDFETSEANVGVSNAILSHLAGKLPVSRLQRDLSDSSALRNTGVGLGHSLLAIRYSLKGVRRLELHEEKLTQDLDQAWETLGEAAQTVLRKSGVANAYERLKELTRGQLVTEKEMRSYLMSLGDTPGMSEADKERLLELTPSSYTGLASSLVDYALAALAEEPAAPAEASLRESHQETQ